MSLLKRLFGGGEAAADNAAPGEEYSGFMIHVAPIKEPQGFRISARIEKTVDGETRTHQMIRADVVSSQDEAQKVTLLKAKALIDQQGDGIFS
ncbi:MAG: HlyU family transcriptional regulator [Pseudomonadota bacterium]